MRHWTVQVNDLVGGFVVTDYPQPLSKHDFRKENSNKSIILSECYDEEIAKRIAELFNKYGTARDLS